MTVVNTRMEWKVVLMLLGQMTLIPWMESGPVNPSWSGDGRETMGRDVSDWTVVFRKKTTRMFQSFLLPSSSRHSFPLPLFRYSSILLSLLVPLSLPFNVEAPHALQRRGGGVENFILALTSLLLLSLPLSLPLFICQSLSLFLSFFEQGNDRLAQTFLIFTFRILRLIFPYGTWYSGSLNYDSLVWVFDQFKQWLFTEEPLREDDPSFFISSSLTIRCVPTLCFCHSRWEGPHWGSLMSSENHTWSVNEWSISAVCSLSLAISC